MNSNYIMNNTIYMTYKKEVPTFVFDRWKKLNPNYNIDFSLDNDCISFLKNNFNDDIANLFRQIPIGMFKADLWRLCKLYVCGGTYADIDLVPYLNLDSLSKDITFYSCLAIDGKSIFQAFMATTTQPRNPLILAFLMSFLQNKPYFIENGPTFDMYNCLRFNLNFVKIEPEKKYDLNEIKIYIKIGTSENKSKIIDLIYFPDDLKYNIKINTNPHNQEFKLKIRDNKLIISRIDKDEGWSNNLSCTIYLKSEQSIYLFKENIGPNNYWRTSYVTNNGTKVFDSRDLDYNREIGWQ